MDRLSVIIPTHHSGKKLEQTLSAIVTQPASFSELIVIVDGRDIPEDVEILQKFRNDKLIIHIQENAGRAGARNKGAELATGEILLFLDSDMIASPALIKDHADFHAKHENVVLLGSALRDISDARSSFDRYLIKIENKWIAGTPENPRITKEHFTFSAANFSIRRSTFLKSGGFDNSLLDSEDFELGVRLFEMNIPIYLDRSVAARHNDFPTIDAFIARLRQYRVSREQLLKTKPRVAEFLKDQGRKKSSGLKKTLSKSVDFIFGGTASRNGFLFRLFPEGIQHSIFKMIIAARY